MSDNKTETKDPGPFNNPVTKSILYALIALAAFGLYLAYNGNTIGTRFWGLVCLAIFGVVWVQGRKPHSPSGPKEVGLIARNGTPLGNEYVVSGEPILLPFFPFYYDTIVFNIEDQEHLFTGDDLVFKTKDGVSMSIGISISGRPNVRDLVDYNQLGGEIKKVAERYRELHIIELQDIINEHTCLEVKEKVKEISAELLERIREGSGSAEGRSIGFDIFRTQIVPVIPEAIQKKLNKSVEETIEAIAEGRDIATNNRLARELQLDDASQLHPGIKTLSEAEQEQIIARLIKSRDLKALDHYRNMVLEAKNVEKDRAVSVRSSGSGKVNTFVDPNNP